MSDDGASEEPLHLKPADASAQDSADLDDIQPQTSGVRPRHDHRDTACVQLQTGGTAHVQPGMSDAQTFGVQLPDVDSDDSVDLQAAVESDLNDSGRGILSVSLIRSLMIRVKLPLYNGAKQHVLGSCLVMPLWKIC